MDYENSTQARSWMYEEESLAECREKATFVHSIGNCSTKLRVRKFACGFAQNKKQSKVSTELKRTKMLALDQETLVHFHAHQIQRLVGPNAIFPELRRSAAVLSTSIMIFRRFYLSNSVIDFHPRSMAVAAALLAVKVDCEPFLDIELLSLGTTVINQRAKNAALCKDELRAVSVQEIEIAERHLLEGNDYRLRCHHPYGAIKVLSADIAAYFRSYGYTHYPEYYDRLLDSLFDRALVVAQSALVYSDVNFLFQPGKIAFAAVAIALEGPRFGGRLGLIMRNYLCMRFPQKSTDELVEFEFEVARIIRAIETCPAIDLDKFSAFPRRRRSLATQIQATEVRRVFSLAARLRGLRNKKTAETVQTHPPTKRKRMRVDNNNSTTRPQSKHFKVARVTPIQAPMS